MSTKQSAERLSESGRRSLSAHTAKFDSPDQWLIDHIVGSGGNPAGYLYGGLTVSFGIRALLQHLGVDTRGLHRVLDLGCGSARVIRWFGDLATDIELFGTDVNSDAIQWSARNVSFARFIQNDLLPPLPFSNGSFDLILAISVFTHMDEEFQLAWLRELKRVAKPGALILVSIHGEDKAAGSIWDQEYIEFLKSGFFYKPARESATVRNLPGYYQVAFHSRSYLERTWSQFFDIKSYVKHGPWYAQELAVLENTGAERSTWNHYSVLDFPISALDTPMPASVIDELHLVISGWAFYPRRECPTLHIWIDNELVGTCTAHLQRGDVGGVFYAHETAQFPGFFTTVPIGHLTKGEHLLWISLANDWFPLCTTYFVTRFNPWIRAYNRCRDVLRRENQLIRRLVHCLRVKLKLRTRLREAIRRFR